MIYFVDLGTYYRSQGHWRIKDGTQGYVQSLSCCVCVCECSYSALLVTPWLRGTALYCHSFAPFLWVRVAISTRAQSRAQSRGTRTLVRRDTSDRNLLRALGPKALPAALGPPAPTATPSSLAHGHSFLVANTLHQPWPMAAFVSQRPLAPVAPSALGGLQPTAASNP